MNEASLRHLASATNYIDLTIWGKKDQIEQSSQLNVLNLQAKSDLLSFEFFTDPTQMENRLLDLQLKYVPSADLDQTTTYNIAESTVRNSLLQTQIMHVIEYPPHNLRSASYRISMNFNTICEATGQRCCYIAYETQGIGECDPEFNIFCGSECSEKNLDSSDLGSCDCKPNEYDT